MAEFSNSKSNNAALLEAALYGHIWDGTLNRVARRAFDAGDTETAAYVLEQMDTLEHELRRYGARTALATVNKLRADLQAAGYLTAPGDLPRRRADESEELFASRQRGAMAATKRYYEALQRRLNKLETEEYSHGTGY